MSNGHQRGKQAATPLLSGLLLHGIMATHFCRLPQRTWTQRNQDWCHSERNSVYDAFCSAFLWNACRSDRVQEMSLMVFHVRLGDVLLLPLCRELCLFVHGDRLHVAFLQYPSAP